MTPEVVKVFAGPIFGNLSRLSPAAFGCDGIGCGGTGGGGTGGGGILDLLVVPVLSENGVKDNDPSAGLSGGAGGAEACGATDFWPMGGIWHLMTKSQWQLGQRDAASSTSLPQWGQREIIALWHDGSYYLII